MNALLKDIGVLGILNEKTEYILMTIYNSNITLMNFEEKFLYLLEIKLLYVLIICIYLSYKNLKYLIKSIKVYRGARSRVKKDRRTKLLLKVMFGIITQVILISAVMFSLLIVFTLQVYEVGDLKGKVISYEVKEGTSIIKRLELETKIGNEDQVIIYNPSKNYKLDYREIKKIMEEDKAVTIKVLNELNKKNNKTKTNKGFVIVTLGDNNILNLNEK